MNNYPSNIFEILLLLERYCQNSQAVLAATGMTGLRSLTNLHLMCAHCLTILKISPQIALSLRSICRGIVGPEQHQVTGNFPTCTRRDVREVPVTGYYGT